VTPAFAGSISTSSLTGRQIIVTRRARHDVRRLAKRRAPRVASRDDVCPLHPFEQAIAIRDGEWTLTPDLLLSA
jgi:hypothetical protein